MSELPPGHFAATAEAIAYWAEDEGALDGAQILAAPPSGIRGGELALELGIVVDPPDADWKQRFRAIEQQIQPSHLRAFDLLHYQVEGDAPWPQPIDEYHLAEVEGAAGLRIVAGANTITLIGRHYAWDLAPVFMRPVVPEPDPTNVTFHGPGALTSGDIIRAMATRGHAIEVYDNWNGSGQSFGSALVRNILAPPRVPDSEGLSGAWLLVPAGTPPTSGKLWITGRSHPPHSYANVTCGDADPELWRELVRALAAQPAFDCATSGNRLIEGDAYARLTETGAPPS